MKDYPFKKSTPLIFLNDNSTDDPEKTESLYSAPTLCDSDASFAET